MHDSSKKRETELLIRLRNDDSLAFEEIYNNFKKPMALKLIKLLRDDELAQDALQDLFTRLWYNRRSIDIELSFSAYLYRIAQNLIIDIYRKAARDKKLRDMLLQSQPNWYQNVEELLIQKDQLVQIQSIIDKLPTHQKTTYLLYRIEGKSYKEISELLKISHSTINKHIYFANKFIKKQLILSPELAKCLIAAYLIAQ